jgi:uncharacterized protein YbjT (DUF2867 family)
VTQILVTGATGFVGGRLVPALIDEGHDVRAMTRRPQQYDGPGTAVGGDVHDPDTLVPALEDVEVAYYLVHSLDSADFEDVDARAAEAFGRAAAEAGVRQIVYLGGLGAEGAELSAHLRSRREVEGLLGAGGVPVTVLRARTRSGGGGARRAAGAAWCRCLRLCHEFQLQQPPPRRRGIGGGRRFPRHSSAGDV